MNFRLITLFKCLEFAGIMAMLGLASAASGSQRALLLHFLRFVLREEPYNGYERHRERPNKHSRK